jgi:hypothetical protein
MEKTTKNTSVKTSSAQIKNSTTVSEWKKHKDMFLSNMSIQSNWSLSKALQIPK